MSNLYGILNIGAMALKTQQNAINVTGHNIANANTPGYSRQRVNMAASDPVALSPGQMGTGVKTVEIQRIYNQFVVNQINNQSQQLGQWEAQKEPLAQLEMLFNVGEDFGLSGQLNEFWNTWQDLANHPADTTVRNVLASKSENLAETFHAMDAHISQLAQQMTENINGAITDINQMSAQVADLNRLISQADLAGQNANDYRDQRDVLIKELSAKVDITTSEENGMVNVSIGNNQSLVSNVRSYDLAFGDPDFTIDTDSGPVTIPGDEIAGGAIRGWLDVRDDRLVQYQDDLDDLAGGIINAVNTLHITGTGLDGTQNPFFSGSDASDIEVNPDIVADVAKIAAAGPGGSIPGDNSLAIAIAELQHDLTMNGNTSTFSAFYQSIVGKIGTDVQQAQLQFNQQQTMADYFDSYRESVSGVNLDEEMVNLVKFQNAYDAAAKIISTVDEMLEQVINMV